MKRNIDITKQNLNCCDVILFETDHINFSYELWFDVDKYFGTNVENDRNAWINFYTNWYPDGTVTALCVVDNQPISYEETDWKLTEDEQVFFLSKMEEYCKYVLGTDLATSWRNNQAAVAESA